MKKAPKLSRTRSSRDEEKSTARRYLAAAALTAVAVLIASQLLLGGDEYRVTAQFRNASQLVPGNEVLVGGTPVGAVDDIELGDRGQALVTFSVNEDFAPLRRGTTATIRSYSLSSIANRQIQLTLPPAGQENEAIPDGGDLSLAETVSEVDLDQIFNTLDPATVEDFKRVIEGFEISYDGVAKRANKGLRYLNPFLYSGRRLFSELSADDPALERLVVDTAQLSGALAERAPDISALIGNLNLMMNAIGDRKAKLSEGIAQLPGFMRQANTTFVNLRTALDDVDPLVEASKPAVERLGPFLTELRGAAADAVPTIRDLDATLRRPGKTNDLVELTGLQPELAAAALGSGAPDCGSDPLEPSELQTAADDDRDQGAFGESVCALTNGLPALAFLRPYTPELVGWFNDFGTSGLADANGTYGRIGTTFNAFSFSDPGLPKLFEPAVPIEDAPGIATGNTERCPGANERDPGDGSTPFTDGGTLDCDPTQVPVGP